MPSVLRPNPETPSAEALAIIANDAIGAHWGGDLIAIATADHQEVQAIADAAIWRHGCDAGMTAPASMDARTGETNG